jgi:HEAT repeat protein/ATP/ADP translocase
MFLARFCSCEFRIFAWWPSSVTKGGKSMRSTPIRFRQWLVRIFPVYPGEGAVVLLCLIVNFLLIAGIMFGRNARDSLFMSQFGVQYLPYMYFANAVVLVVCSAFYTSLVDRMDRGKFLGGISMIFVILLLASRAILIVHPRWFYPALYMLAQAIWNFSLLQFWTFLGDLFDTRQAKRLFPVIAIGALLGMIGVGLSSKMLVTNLGTENILVVWAGLIFMAVIIGGIILWKFRAPKAAAATDQASHRPAAGLSEWDKFKESATQVRQVPLLRTMAMITFLLWTLFTVVDFCFNKTMRDAYPDKNQLTAFLGEFRGWAGFLCLVVQLFLTSTLISRLGVGTTIAFHPAYLTFATLWMTVGFGYVSVFAAKLGDHVLLYTIQDSSFQLLYSPVPLDQRARIRGFIDGYVKPLSMGAAGILLLLGMMYLTLRQISLLAWVMAATWLVFSLGVKKGYIQALLRNLQMGGAVLRQASVMALSKMQDPAALSLLMRTLQTESPERIVAAILLLEPASNEETLQTLTPLLAHADARVRATAAAVLGRQAPARHVDQFTQLLGDADERVRANAIEALGKSGVPAAAAHARRLLENSSKRVRVNAVVALAEVEGASAAEPWIPLLQEFTHGNRDERATAIYALKHLPLAESEEMLIQLLHDPDLRLRCEAAKALGRVGTACAIPCLVETLAGHAEMRHCARRSLAKLLKKCDEACLEALADTASSSDRPEICSELADVLGRVQHPRVIPTLIGLLRHPEWRVRWKVLKAFGRQARRGPLPEDARAALFQFAAEELAGLHQDLLCSLALPPQPATDGERLLTDALREDHVKIEERVFRMLGILCGREQMQAIFTKLNSRDVHQQADALEALDTLAPKAIGRQLLAILEPTPVCADPEALPPQPVVATLLKHSKPWLRACTAYYFAQHPASDGQALLQPLLSDRYPIVRETALYAGWQAFGDAWRPQLEAARTASDSALRRAAQRILSSIGTSTSRSSPMLLTVEKVLFLKTAPLFAGLDGEELAALAEIAEEEEFPAGEVIFEEGHPAEHLYITLRGKVEVFHRTGSTEHAIASLGEKECFGEMAILDEEPRSASVKAVAPTQVMKIDKESFAELIHERPQISFAIFRILSSRLRHKNLEAEQAISSFDSGRHYA